ncbi:XRE family transcriptional regulator [Lactococcus cremoris]|jgi:transcriptional regulator with XRE-family HTH domain|uniref:XRE family transcriptional regulator n=1 Tax=Lactococcus lactis subsp. cremoris TaxID=1359 RepID=UPI0007AE647C|nr:XRE family transcriptional regulator [Lactococcus cremoris]KZK41739.1 Transcriptional regulator xre family [Lactococcus cremoris]MCT0503721.1 XRE family transcriptional regulator [Lactococcus cremoris]MCT0504976.1 XRE family transcriptional regulator [Lactococcus cremoris]TRW54001.1 helix-turn-helix domain-containing protein [Lactococcus lactis]
MTILDRIKELSKSRDKTVKEVAIELGLGENYLYSLKNKIPNGQTLQKLADYFHVSVDYLLGREESKTTNEPVDLKKLISEKKPTSWDDPRIDWNEWVSFDGEPISDDVKKMLFAIYGDKLTD